MEKEKSLRNGAHDPRVPLCKNNFGDWLQGNVWRFDLYLPGLKVARDQRVYNVKCSQCRPKAR